MKLEGLVLESKYPELQLLVKGPMQKVWKDGFPVDEQKIIVLAFDRYLCELDVMARNQEWGEGERAAVDGQLSRQLADPQFRDAWVHEAPKPAKPWPSYDETHHNQVAGIAQATGTVESAITYETRGREGGPRESVLRKLQELQAEAPEETGGAASEPEDLFAA